MLLGKRRLYHSSRRVHQNFRLGGPARRSVARIRRVCNLRGMHVSTLTDVRKTSIDHLHRATVHSEDSSTNEGLERYPDAEGLREDDGQCLF